MPTYEYLCGGCGEKFDFFQSMTSPALKKHPGCKHNDSSVKRIVSGGSGLIFKGSGFYLTDYKNKNRDSKSGDNSKNENKSKKEIKTPVKKSKIKEN
tara:strand:- start:114 stop:404 length:291 start_codon:yes stop_codon:yes gene_type:complete